MGKSKQKRRWGLAMWALTLAAGSGLAGTEYHVAMNGSDGNDGTRVKPFKTIMVAANVAQAGDVITVHAGVYRERINPPRGGESDAKRIVYQAAAGETVTITGSEPAKGWVREAGDVWKLTLPNSYFGAFNPYSEKVQGDWFDSRGRVHHRGMVFLDGVWLLEASGMDELMKPADERELWFATVDDGPSGSTVIYARFPGIDPNHAEVEIMVRPTVFTPEKTNRDYITVRGFVLKNAASNWAAPTSGQHGLLTAYWCKGWIIEENEICYSRCNGIVLGKYSDEWDNRRGTKEGYDGTIADALKTGGWTKEKIGGHVVRNNHIHHCGQTGIVGSLGCAFSRIENNEIHDINNLGIWSGWEMAGIKFHGAIDVVISGNHIYRCGAFGGLWLDWMAQGTQVMGNLFHDNEGNDIFTEVNHGPFIMANNIMVSPGAYFSNSQGGAYAHNLIMGKVSIRNDKRCTPYHKVHGTEIAGTNDCRIGDLRWYNNLLLAGCKLDACNSAALPVTLAGNVYTKGAKASKFDAEAILRPEYEPGAKIVQKADGWYLAISMDRTWGDTQKRNLVTTKLLGKAVIPGLPFENADGSDVTIGGDYFGKNRNKSNPFPGPFENVGAGCQEIKVWPK